MSVTPPTATPLESEKKTPTPVDCRVLGLIPQDWREVLATVVKSPAAQKLEEQLQAEYQSGAIVCPPSAKIFRSLELCPFQNVRVVILGQDPYHTPGQANGLAFSCEEVPLQPSLRNLYQEIERDTRAPVQNAALLRGDLSAWAKQGVLLLNTILTVRASRPKSHNDLGWQSITQEIIAKLSATKPHLVFMLWGRNAHDAVRFIVKPEQHLLLLASHPSPLSYANSSGRMPSFKGCRHFQLCNNYLSKVAQVAPIMWN